MADLKNRIIGEGEETPERLVKHPGNWRVHTKYQEDILEGMLKEVGWVQRVIVNQRTGRIVDGHLRVQVAIKRKESSIPVLYVDLTEDEERKVLATLDPIAALAETDQTLLDNLLNEVGVEDDLVVRFLSEMKSSEIQPEAGSLRDLTIMPTPEMAWALVGIPLYRFSEIANHIEAIANLPDTFCETTANDQKDG